MDGHSKRALYIKKLTQFINSWISYMKKFTTVIIGIFLLASCSSESDATSKTNTELPVDQKESKSNFNQKTSIADEIIRPLGGVAGIRKGKKSVLSFNNLTGEVEKDLPATAKSLSKFSATLVGFSANESYGNALLESLQKQIDSYKNRPVPNRLKGKPESINKWRKNIANKIKSREKGIDEFKSLPDIQQKQSEYFYKVVSERLDKHYLNKLKIGEYHEMYSYLDSEDKQEWLVRETDRVLSTKKVRITHFYRLFIWINNVEYYLSSGDDNRLSGNDSIQLLNSALSLGDGTANNLFDRNFVNQLYDLRSTAMNKALETNNTELYNKLIDSIWPYDDEVSNSLKDSAKNVNELNDEREHSLFRSARRDFLRDLWSLLDAGANPNLQNKEGDTALIHAISYENCENSKIVCSRGRYAVDGIDMDPTVNRITKINLLLNYGANPNIANNEGKTALHYASLFDDIDIKVIKTLIKAGAELNTKDNKGNTPLILATRIGDKEKVELLIENGADVNIRNDEQFSPLIIAVDNKNQDLVNLFIKNKAQSSLQRTSTFKIDDGNKRKEVVTYENAKIKSFHLYNEEEQLLIEGITNADNTMSFKEFIHRKLDGRNLSLLKATWHIKDGSRHGSYENYRYGDNASKPQLQEKGKYDNGKKIHAVIYECEYFYKDLNSLFDVVCTDAVSSEYKYNPKDGITIITAKNSYQNFSAKMKGAIPYKDIWYRGISQKLFYTYGPISYNDIWTEKRKLLERTYFDDRGGTIFKEIYDGKGNVVKVIDERKDYAKGIMESYLNNPKKGLFNSLIEIEEKNGYQVDEAKSILKNIIQEVKNNITIKNSYSRSEAISILNEISYILRRKFGITYDDDHIDVLSQTLVNREMDCDIISMLYVTIGDHLDLPLALALYPEHGSVIWADDSYSIYWEAATRSNIPHTETSLRYYQNWFYGNPYKEDIINSKYWGKPLTKREAFLHGIWLASRTAKSNKEVGSYKKILNEIAQPILPHHVKRHDKRSTGEDLAMFLETMVNQRFEKMGRYSLFNRVRVAARLPERYNSRDRKMIAAMTIKLLEGKEREVIEQTSFILQDIALGELADAYTEIKKYDKAVNVYKTKLEYTSNEVDKDYIYSKIAKIRKLRDTPPKKKAKKVDKKSPNYYLYELGEGYRLGKLGFPQNIEKAKKYYTKSAELGNAEAQNRLEAMQ